MNEADKKLLAFPKETGFSRRAVVALLWGNGSFRPTTLRRKGRELRSLTNSALSELRSIAFEFGRSPSVVFRNLVANASTTNAQAYLLLSVRDPSLDPAKRIARTLGKLPQGLRLAESVLLDRPETLDRDCRDFVIAFCMPELANRVWSRDFSKTNALALLAAYPLPQKVRHRLRKAVFGEEAPELSLTPARYSLEFTSGYSDKTLGAGLRFLSTRPADRMLLWHAPVNVSTSRVRMWLR